MIARLTGYIKCEECRFARPDEDSSSRLWTAYECGNVDSEFYKCLLNVSPQGNKQDRITWRGCELGRRSA